MSDDFSYPSSALYTLTVQHNTPVRLTICGDGDDKIELFYDREGKRWDCKIIGDQTSSVKTFMDWILSGLPVCECQRKK